MKNAPAVIESPQPAAESAEASAVDAMAADAAPREFPKDAPGLWPYLRLPFRTRATFFRKFGELNRMQDQLVAVEKKRKRSKAQPKQEETLEHASLMFDLYGAMDELMRLAAVDVEAYDEWVSTHSDEEFADLFAAYVERSQPGEASSSAS